MSDITGLLCVYCHKSEDEVLALLAFPDHLNICEECVWSMVETIASDHPDWRERVIQRMKSIPRVQKHLNNRS